MNDWRFMMVLAVGAKDQTFLVSDDHATFIFDLCSLSSYFI